MINEAFRNPKHPKHKQVVKAYECLDNMNIFLIIYPDFSYYRSIKHNQKDAN